MKHRIQRHSILFSLAAFCLAPAVIGQASSPNFSGTWKQSNERCEPKKNGDVLRRIEQHGPDLIVETTVSRSDRTHRHALQRYKIGGKVSVSTGADGDEFHTSVVWQDSALVFSIEEHEDGKIILSREVWSLIEKNSVLQIDREINWTKSKEAGKQLIVFTRQAPGNIAQ
jgi:hypothetical protein